MIVQSLWVGDRLGTIEQLGIRSFLMQGHEFHLYAYGPVENLPEGATWREASAILPPSDVFTNPEGFGKGSFAAFSDVFRYKLLLDKGGWWVDTDLVCLRPFQFEADYVFASETSRAHVPTTASSALKAPAGAELLAYCLEVCETRDRDRLVWGEIGPELLDDAIWRFGLERFSTPVHYFNPINYFDFGQFTEPGFDFTRLDGSYGVHLWQQMWKSSLTDPAADLPRDSLMGMLRERYLDSAASG